MIHGGEWGLWAGEVVEGLLRGHRVKDKEVVQGLMPGQRVNDKGVVQGLLHGQIVKGAEEVQGEDVLQGLL